jgi:C1A family cysteine protease
MSRRDFGWVKDPPDYRDFRFGAPRAAIEAAADPKVDLREKRSPKGKPATPKVFDQGQLGSCVSNATTSVVQYIERLHDDPDQDRLSRLWLYWYMRERMDTINEDSGGYPRDSWKLAAKLGVPREVYWPYEVENFRVKPQAGSVSALHHRVLEYRSVDDSNEQDMRSCIAEGYPFVFGFAVYESFDFIGADGFWSGERGDILGYHAVSCWGYDFSSPSAALHHWIVRNSWGDEWGDKGYFYVPRAWLPLEAFDCWTGRRVTVDPVPLAA